MVSMNDCTERNFQAGHIRIYGINDQSHHNVLVLQVPEENTSYLSICPSEHHMKNKCSPEPRRTGDSSIPSCSGQNGFFQHIFGQQVT
jgi:hypothetical protein